MSKSAAKRPSDKKLPMQTKVVFLLTIFVMIVLAIIWLFQVWLLGIFYENTKKKDIEKMAETMSTLLQTDAENLQENINKNAYIYQIGIVVYKMTDIDVWGVTLCLPVQLAASNVYGDSLIHHLDYKTLSDLYDVAVESNGLYLTNTSAQDLLNFSDTEEEQNSEPKQSVKKEKHKIGVSVISVDDNEYLVLMDVELEPISAIIRTRNLQIGWITSSILLVALLLSLVITKMISKPVKQMNESAKKLAKGNYNVDFTGSGCRELVELGETLNYAAEELSRADVLQKELLANISHDLRTPLTMIKGYGEVMRDIPGELTQENLQVVIDESTHLSDLVNDLLDLSKLQAGIRTVVKEPLDCFSILGEICERYNSLLKHRGFEIRLQADQNNVMVMADKTAFLQVIYNLLNNAVNYSGENKIVEIIEETKNDVVRISVIDHGIGIEEKELPNIWDRYYKVDHVHKRAMVGTGLGLSIVKQLMDLQGGKYGVSSIVGEGSVFWIEMPKAENMTNDVNMAEEKNYVG